MTDKTPIENEVAETIIACLNLEGVAVSDINAQAPLFNEGLGLDSIDALEIALAISEKYGFQLRSDSPDNERIFSSLSALSRHIETNRIR